MYIHVYIIYCIIYVIIYLIMYVYIHFKYIHVIIQKYLDILSREYLEILSRNIKKDENCIIMNQLLNLEITSKRDEKSRVKITFWNFLLRILKD